MNITLIIVLLIISVVGIIIGIVVPTNNVVKIIIAAIFIMIGSVALNILSEVAADYTVPFIYQPSGCVPACTDGSDDDDYAGGQSLQSIVMGGDDGGNTGDDWFTEDDGYTSDDWYSGDDEYTGGDDWYSDDSEYTGDEYNGTDSNVQRFAHLAGWIDTSIYEPDFVMGSYNTDSILIIAHKTSLMMTCEMFSEPTTLGSTSLHGARVQLIDYYTGDVITFYTDINGYAEAADIPEGFYFYTIEMDGYEPYQSHALLEISCGSGEWLDRIIFGECLMEYNTSFMPGFTVRLLAPDGTCFPSGTRISVNVSENDVTYGSASYCEMYLDSDGYVVEWDEDNPDLIDTMIVEYGCHLNFEVDDFTYIGSIYPEYGVGSYTLTLEYNPDSP